MPINEFIHFEKLICYRVRSGFSFVIALNVLNVPQLARWECLHFLPAPSTAGCRRRPSWHTMTPTTTASLSASPVLPSSKANSTTSTLPESTCVSYPRLSWLRQLVSRTSPGLRHPKITQREGSQKSWSPV